MKKSINILLIFMITFFTLPIGSITAFADEKSEEKTYENIEDGEYDITAKAMHETKEEASGAASFINEEAKLYVKGGEVQLIITVPHNDMAQIAGMQVEGNEGKTEESDNLTYRTYKLDTLKKELMSQVQYAVPSLGMEHDVPFRFILEGLDDLPEQPDEEKAPEEREEGQLLTEEEADAVYQLNYETDSKATEGQLKNPVTLLKKDDKEYIQISVDENGAQYFRSLKINEKEVTWNSITEGPYNIQFELPNGIEDELELSMVIQAGQKVMPHDDIKLWFDKDSLETIKEPEKDDEKAPEERKEGQLLTEKEADAVYQLNYETDSESIEANLENPVKLLEKDNKEYVQISVAENGAQYFRSLKINEKEVTWNSITEGPYTIQFELPDGIEGELDLSMVIQAGPNAMPHDNIKLWFDEDSLETIKEPKPEEPESPEESELDPENLDEGVYTLGYTFLEKGEDNASAMDGFTEGPAYVKVNKDDKQFVAMTLTNADWIKGFKVNNKSVKVLQENEEENTRVVEFPIENLLEKQVGSVSVDVPGVYKTTHDVDLVFDVDLLKSAKDNDYPEDQNVEQSEPDNDYDNPIDNDDNEAPSELDPKNLDEGIYTVDNTFLEKGTDNASAMDGFTKGPAYVKVDKNGKQFVAVTLTSASMIKGFKVNGKDVKILQEDKDIRIVQFMVADLTQKQTGKVSVEVPGMYSMEHEVDLVFDVDSLKSAKDSDYPEVQNANPSPEPTDPEKEEQSTKEPVTPTTQDEKSELVPNKAYAIDYVVKHETEDRASAADNFFEKPGHLLYLDDEKFIQLKINNWAMIDWLRTEHGGDVIVVKKNDDGSALIQFKVEGELSEVINLSMSVTVPNVYEDKVHEARLILDLESKTEVDATDFLIIVDKKDNPDKPEFGDNGDNDTEDDKDKTVTPDKKDNPQTGDKTNILLYAMLLIGSLIPLAVKLKKRFI